MAKLISPQCVCAARVIVLGLSFLHLFFCVSVTTFSATMRNKIAAGLVPHWLDFKNTTSSAFKSYGVKTK